MLVSMVAVPEAELQAEAPQREAWQQPEERRAQAEVLRREAWQQPEGPRAQAEVLRLGASRPPEAPQALAGAQRPEERLRQAGPQRQAGLHRAVEVLRVASRPQVELRRLVVLARPMVASGPATWAAARARPGQARCGCSGSSSFVGAACPI